VLITGANQGGKSTLLRSIGTAQLLLQAGAVRAGSLASGHRSAGTSSPTSAARRISDLQRGKLEEELNRMRTIVERIRPGDLLLANESFAATNEREGSELARQVFRAHLDVGIRVVAVTHLYDLAESLYRTESGRGVFLRAGVRRTGSGPSGSTPGAPLPTSYGQDLYRRIFGDDPAR
jgi:DNA mismatch repair ATPase MutS